MKKRIWMVWGCILLLVLTACGANASPTEEAKSTVEGFFQAFAKMDTKEMAKFLPKEMREKQQSAEKESSSLNMDDPNVKKQVDMYKSVFAKVQAAYVSGEIEKGKTEGTLTYKVTAPNMMDLASKMMSIIGPNGQPDYSKLDLSTVKTDETSLDIDVKYDDDRWVIADPQTLFMKTMGVQGNATDMMPMQP